MTTECNHDWKLDFTGSMLMWRCTKCKIGEVATSSAAKKPKESSHNV